MSIAPASRVKKPKPTAKQPAGEPIGKPAPLGKDVPPASEPRPPLEQLFDLSKPPGYYREAAKIALLRRERKTPHDQLLVDFRGPQLFTELQAAGQTVWSGDWRWQASVDDQPLAADGTWEEVCWHTDRDVDYLELELPLSAGWKLGRQMLLAREHNFLYLADALIGNDAEAAAKSTGTPAAAPVIRYRSTLPLAPGVQFEPAKETREGWLTAKKRKLASALPLALPEWRAEFCAAEWHACGSELSLEFAAQGRNVYAPLFFDLSRTRFRQPLTWRRLTVAESLEIVPRDRAVGYRVQVGDWQWLFYRSLVQPGNRTLLGQNYSTEFVACRINRNGTTEDILEIK
jgi:hypothetical protein